MSEGTPGMIARLPAAPGVYRFRDAGERVLYIGRTTKLRSRVASYWSDLRERDHLVPMVGAIADVEAVVCDSAHEAAWLERNLLQTSLPAWNRTPGGQENEVYIRLNDRPSAPGLTVEHLRQPATGARYFGPYLGGLRARQAVAALNRILPLSATSTRLRGARLDMARVRGVAAANRTELADRLTAVLERQHEAVALARAELEELRDRAAAVLAFELAARIQVEMQALDWVTCPQRVTTTDTGDVDICGWAFGVAVRFGIRGGRLCTWSQQACSQSSVAANLAATPAQWAGFARRNAELAAALAFGRPASAP